METKNEGKDGRIRTEGGQLENRRGGLRDKEGSGLGELMANTVGACMPCQTP